MYISSYEEKVGKSDKRTGTSNGCGPEKIGILAALLNFLAPESVEKCCNEHDFCYANCTQTFYDCEIQFDDCLLEAAREMQCSVFDITCNLTKLWKMMTTVFQEFTETFGCNFYQESQQRHCSCEPKI